MKKTFTNYCLGTALALCLTGNASAAWTFADGDIMLGFRTSAGTGFQKDLFFNLGSSAAIRDGGLTGLRGNINNDLVATFGATWFNRTDLTFGAIGNLSTTSPTATAGFTPGQPDPTRIAYITRGTLTPGDAADHPSVSGNSLGSNLVGVSTLEGILSALTETPNLAGVAIFDRANSPTQWDSSSWSTRVPVTGLSFGLFQNISSPFGQSGSVVYADIQRLGGSTTLIPYTNTTVATIAIDNLGNISVVPEPSSLTLVGLAALALVTRRRR